MEVVRGSRVNPVETESLIAALEKMGLSEATLYIGYPVVATPNEPIAIEALLTCVEYGVVVFDLSARSDSDWVEVEARQAEIALSLQSKLMRHVMLTDRRRLAVPVNVVTYLSSTYGVILGDKDSIIIVADSESLADELVSKIGDKMDEKYIKPLNAAIQNVTTIKPPKKRLSVQQPGSKGSVIKSIEREIANLDFFQKKAAVESPEGPQRIRGLAGSGKTIVLALKAAYLHAKHPDWDIVVTFYTHALKQQFRSLVQRFMFDQTEDEPNWSKLRILHSWGGRTSPGVYSLIAESNGLQPHTFSYAREKYGYESAFEGLCEEVVAELAEHSNKELFDVVLIDEAQDFGKSFFQLVYRSLRDPKRIVWAYDELQSLNATSMVSLAEMFGTNLSGQPNVDLVRHLGKPNPDIILPRCYRNTPWALTVAHALGFGIYRTEGLVQMFDDMTLWKDIGYEITEGDFAPGENVTLRRRSDATPDFFKALLTPSNAISFHSFRSSFDQMEWVVTQILKNLTEDELEPSDILVIFPTAPTARSDSGPLIASLYRNNVQSHLVGVTSETDEFVIHNSVAIAGIHRAKGNEVPVVYVVNSDECYGGYQLAKRRNTLFTAITRSRAWVRVCGVGVSMDAIRQEFDCVCEKQFSLSFKVPTDQEREKLRRIHRDRSLAELTLIEAKTKNVVDLLTSIQSGEISMDDIHPELRSQLAELLRDAES